MNAVKSRASGKYSVHPGVAMMQKWIRDLPEKTGRSLEEWIALVKKSGPATEKERREWLKKEHKLGTNSAIRIAERAEGKGAEEDTADGYLRAAEEWVEGQYAEAKAGLRPLYEELLGIALKMGAKASPGKTAVSLYRNHVFASKYRNRLDIRRLLLQIREASMIKTNVRLHLSTQFSGRVGPRDPASKKLAA
jgi:Domain of unknown function (DUF4287)